MMHYFRHIKKYRFLLRAGFIVCLWSLGSGALWFLLPDIIHSYTKNDWHVGLFLALAGALALISDIPLGDLADKLGRKKIISFGFTMLFFLGVFMHFIESTPALLFFIVLLGVTYPAVLVPLIAYVMDLSSKKESSTYMGAEMSFIQLGFGLGPLLAGAILSYPGISEPQTVLALIYSTSCLGGLILTQILLEEKPKYEPFLQALEEVVIKDKIIVGEIKVFEKLREVGRTVLAVTLLLAVYDGVIWSFVPRYYHRITTSPFAGGVILAAFILPLIIFEIPAGILADRIGRRKTLFMGLFLAGASTILFSMSTTVVALIFTAFLATVGIALCWPSIEGMLAANSPIHKRGEVTGVWAFSRDLGYVVGPIVGGAIYFYASPEKTFTYAGAALLIASLYGLFSLRGSLKGFNLNLPKTGKKQAKKDDDPYTGLFKKAPPAPKQKSDAKTL